MALLSLDDYFAYLNLSPACIIENPDCEVCGQTEFAVLRESTRISDELQVKLSVVCCQCCGHIFQVPRFDADFYRAYYQTAYRRILSGSLEPDRALVDDQIARGEHLFRSLSPFLAKTGRLLDVGCSAGGIMTAFIKRGWSAFGTDPDAGYVDFGLRELNAPIAVRCAEEMELASESYDLVIITGSLEHVVNPNTVLSLCRRASAPDALLLLEGRGLAQARQAGRCGHNHRRFLTGSSLELLMCKHGWESVWITDEELSGPTRPQSVFGLGRACRPMSDAELRRRIATKRAPAATVRRDFAAWAIA
jgi:SAM-dependent methyltransferase